MSPHIRYLYDQIQRWRLDNRSDEAKTARMLIERGMMSEDLARAYVVRLQLVIDEIERRSNFLPRPPEMEEIYPDGPPSVVLGRCIEAPDVPIGSFLQGPTHCIFAGTTGYGKTVGIRRFVIEADRLSDARQRPLSFIILDRKLDYQDIPDRLGSRWCLYDAHGALRLGLQPPPSVPREVWINVIATLFCIRSGLIASWKTIVHLVTILVASLNPQPTDRASFPNFELLLEGSDRLPKAAVTEKDHYLASARQNLFAATYASGKLFKAFRGLDLERDIIALGKSVVIAMTNIEPPWLGHFVTDLFASQVLFGRLHSRRRVDDPDVIFVLDESDDTVSYDAEKTFPQGSLSPIARLLRQGRELGIGVVLGLGLLGTVSRHILNSATHHFIFRNADSDARTAAARTLGIGSGPDELIGELDKGECIVRVPGPWPHPMLARIEYVPPCRRVVTRDDEHDYVPSKPISDMPEVLRALGSAAADYRNAAKRRNQERYGELSAKSRELLYLASMHPYWPTARLFERMNEPPTPPVREAMLRQVKEQRYANIFKTRVGRKALWLIQLLAAATQLFGKPPVKLRGGGSWVHICFANWICMVGRGRGYDAQCEWTVPKTNHRCDAVWRVNGSYHAFECVVTCDVNLDAHLTASLTTPDTPVERVTIVAPLKSRLVSLQKKLSPRWGSEFGARVDFQLVEKFERELWS